MTHVLVVALDRYRATARQGGGDPSCLQCLADDHRQFFNAGGFCDFSHDGPRLCPTGADVAALGNTAELVHSVAA